MDMGYSLDKKYLVIAFVHWAIVIFGLWGYFFLTKPTFHILAVLCCFVLIAIFWQLVAYAIKRACLDTMFRRWLGFSGLYFLFSLIMLVLIWPGNWFWDELNILISLSLFDLYPWQHVLTSVFYLGALLLFPSPISVIILQLLCISLLVGYFVDWISRMAKGSRWIWCSYIPFLLTPVLTQNYLAYRSTLLGYLVLYFIVRLADLRSQGCAKGGYISMKQLMVLAIVAAVISTWRGEGYGFIVFAPLLFCCFLYRFSSPKQKAVFCSIVWVLAANILMLQNASWECLGDPLDQKRNELTVYLRPLGSLIKYAQAHGRDDLVAEIDGILNLESLKQYENVMTAYWSDRLMQDKYFEEGGDKKLKQVYWRLIKTYPLVFFRERFENVADLVPLVSDDERLFRGKRDVEAKAIFLDPPFSRILNPSLRLHVLEWLMLKPWPHLRALAFSIFIPIVILCIMAGYALLRKRYAVTLTALAILTMATLAFLSAPERFFMYYFTVYLTAYAFLTAFCIMAVSKRNKA